MPTVPIVTGRSIQDTPLQGGFQSTPDVSSGTRAVAAGLDQAGDVADRMAQRETQRAAYDAQTAVQSRYLDYQNQALNQRQGAKAKGVLSDTDAWWTKAAEGAGKDLPPQARMLVTRQLQQLRTQSLETFGRFENQQLENAADTSWAAAKTVTKSIAAANPFVATPGRDSDGNPVMVDGVQSAVADLRTKNSEYAARKGMTDPAVLQALNLKDTTELHTQVLQGLMRNSPDAARAYFDRYKDQINGEQHAELGKMVDTQGLLAKAQTTGAELAQQFDFMHTGDALKAIDKMDGSPELKQAIRKELEHRHSAQQSDDRVNNAALVGKLDEMVQRGMSQAAIERTAEFQGVRDKGTVLKLVRERTEHAVNLAAAVESRDYTRVQRLRAEQEYRGHLKMFAYSDPDVLSSMTRPAVAALALEIGPSNTGHLLAKYDAMQKPGALADAKVDHDDMMVALQNAGLKPMEKSKTEEGKVAIASAQSRLERALTERQLRDKRPMSREEKNGFLAKEAAAIVMVDSKWIGSPDATPVMDLTPDQLSRVIVPPQVVSQFNNPPPEMAQAIRAAGARNGFANMTDGDVREKWVTKQLIDYGLRPTGNLDIDRKRWFSAQKSSTAKYIPDPIKK